MKIVLEPYGWDAEYLSEIPYQRPEDGGLNRLNKTTGKFTRYMHDPANPESISNNKVRAIFEDSKENFWIGTGGDGLHTLDRNTGIFTHYYYDKSHPEKLSRPPQIFENGEAMDFISFITEDSYGSLLIGTLLQGINYYNPKEKKVTHHGYLRNVLSRSRNLCRYTHRTDRRRTLAILYFKRWPDLARDIKRKYFQC